MANTWAKFALPVILGKIALIREVKNKDLREESDEKGISRNFLYCSPGVIDVEKIQSRSYRIYEAAAHRWSKATYCAAQQALS